MTKKQPGLAALMSLNVKLTNYVLCFQSSGVAVNPQCVSVFNDIKLKHMYRFIVYALTPDLREIEVHQTAPPSKAISSYIILINQGSVLLLACSSGVL